MSDLEAAPRKPRLFVRLFFVILIVLGIAAGLAYIKLTQFEAMGAQNSVPPPPISVTVAEANSAVWNKRIKAIGSLIAIHGVNIASEVAGVLKSINFESGQEVQAGSLIIELDSSAELAALASARARYEADYSQYQRLLKLKNEAFVTSNDLESQASLASVARAQVGIAEAALAKKSIRAPFSGKLGIRQVDVGEYIAPGNAIVTLQSVDKLLLDFTLPESNFNDLSVGQPIRFKVRSYPDKQFEGKVQSWNPILDKNTRNVTVRAEVDNQQRELAPGMFAEMELQSVRKITVLSVPETAIFYNIYGEAVYVLETPERDEAGEETYIIAARQVKVAYRIDGMAGITEGVKAGEKVVSAGQLKLYPSLKVAIVDDVPEFASTIEQVK